MMKYQYYHFEAVFPLILPPDPNHSPQPIYDALESNVKYLDWNFLFNYLFSFLGCSTSKSMLELCRDCSFQTADGENCSVSLHLPNRNLMCQK